MEFSACVLALALTNLRQQHRLRSYTLMIYGYPEKGKKEEGRECHLLGCLRLLAIQGDSWLLMVRHGEGQIFQAMI